MIICLCIYVAKKSEEGSLKRWVAMGFGPITTVQRRSGKVRSLT